MSERALRLAAITEEKGRSSTNRWNEKVQAIASLLLKIQRFQGQRRFLRIPNSTRKDSAIGGS
jgi:hypothetical protein